MKPDIKTQVVGEWTGYDPLYQGRKIPLKPQTHLDCFFEAAHLSPQAPAISMGEQTLSYAEVLYSVNALAAWMLEDVNIKRGDRVALYLPNSLTYIIGVLASWRAGLVMVNLNSLSEHTDLLIQLQDSGAKILITVPRFLPQVERMLLQTSIRHILTTQSDDYINFVGRLKTWVSPQKWIEKWRQDNTVIRYTRLRQILKRRPKQDQDWPVVTVSDLALIQYTSGTTGEAKGVSLSHQNLNYNYQQVKNILSTYMVPDACGLCPIALQHIVGLTFTLNMLSSGGHVVISSITEVLHKPKVLQRFNFSIFAGFPYLYDQLLKREQPLACLQQVSLFLCGGSFASRSLQQAWFEHTGRYLCEAYGMSEASPIVCMNPPERIRLGTVGVVLPNTDVCVVGRNQEALGFDQPGELWIRGKQIMKGYWHQPNASHEVITFDHWFKTGDIVSVSTDGFVSMLERKKDAFWVQSQQVFPHEIEQVIIQHEDVIDCALVQDAKSAQPAIRLFVIARHGLTPDALKRFIGEQCSSKVMPDTIEFVDHLPFGSMGKVLRRLLRDRDDGLSTVRSATPPERVDAAVDLKEEKKSG